VRGTRKEARCVAAEFAVRSSSPEAATTTLAVSHLVARRRGVWVRKSSPNDLALPPVSRRRSLRGPLAASWGPNRPAAHLVGIPTTVRP